VTVELPETTKTLGTRSVWIIPEADVTDPNALTAAIVNAGFKATCYIYGNGGTVSGAQQKGEAPRKLCETKSREQLGTVQESITDIQYSYKPQADDTDAANEMKAAMVDGTRVYVAERLGVDDSTAAVAGQFFNAFLTDLGYRNRTQTGEDEYSEYSVTQGAVVVESFYDIELA
jgi:hypothetical protein